jgi:putative endonuclease
MAKGKVGLGRRGETLAAKVLARAGYTIVERNWGCARGEVDLVASRDGALTFFEVRTRRGGYGTPEESLTPRKRARMEAVARNYLGQGPTRDVAWNLGFVAVEMDGRGTLQRITVYPTLEGEPWDAEI